jgi:hypothetical protein
MSKRRVPAAGASAIQSTFAWRDPETLLGAPARGEVVYEAPDLSRVVRAKTRAARVRVAPAAARDIQSFGLPFGVRRADGRAVCWSCGVELEEGRVVTAGPGDTRCPGCGAKLPFGE